MGLSYRTDVAAEAFRSLGGEPCSGIAYDESIIEGFAVSRLAVTSPEGEKKLGKPIGNYAAVRLDKLLHRGSALFPAAVGVLSGEIRRLLPAEFGSVMAVGLGNPDITPDALGSIAAANVIATRHLREKAPADFASMRSVSVLRPGVLGTSGIESSVQIRSVCGEIKPDTVIVIDALAALDADSLCRTVQVSDAGICPGSGVGNSRAAVNASLVGVPVISVGAPTVIDAGAICDDPSVGKMFVTPRSVDYDVRLIGRLIGYAIDLALHDGLTVADIDALIG